MKVLSKIIFSGTKRPMTMKIGMQHWVLEYYKIRSNVVPGMTCRGQILSFTLLYGKKVKQWIFFSETVVVYYIKVGRCSQLNEYMKLYEYQRSRSFIDLHPNYLDSIFLNFFSSITADFNISSALR